MEISLIPAAQYLRMSTDLQQYSLHNQADAIARYAALTGFRIVKTYSDAARSGLLLKNRAGLKQLLKDVGDGQFEFRAVLVYDVSRWGRFQDMDESAHYEYLCKSAGAPVYYCAELFSNSNNLADFIMKALKRMMAGEYSRELGEKVRQGMFNLASRGYRVGGPPGYGFRRQLIDVSGNEKQLLKKGERKSISTDRIILVPKSPQEASVIKSIFHLFVNKRRSISSITETLNQDGVPFLDGRKWPEAAVNRMLRNPQYCGTQVWGRTTARLFARLKRVPREQWATRPDAFPAIISKELFDRAQERVANFACNLSDAQLIEKAREVLRVHGKLSAEIIQSSQLCPTARTYYERFGGMACVYAKLGIQTPVQLAALATRRRFNTVRKALIASLLQNFPDQLQEIHPKGPRSLLVDRESGTLIGVRVACSRWNQKKGRYWFLTCHKVSRSTRQRITTVALLDEKHAMEQVRIFPNLKFPGRSIRLYEQSEWLSNGRRLEDISDFLHVLEHIKNAYPG